MVSKKYNIGQIIIVIIALLFIFFVATKSTKGNGEAIVLVSFAINGIFWLVITIRTIIRHAFSFKFMHFLFCLLFLFFAPLVQYLSNSFVYSQYLHFDNSLVIKTNIILLIWTLLFCFANSFSVNKTSEKRFYQREYDTEKLHGFLIFMTLMSTLITLYKIRTVGFSNLFSHATSSITFNSSSITSLINSLMLMIVYFSVSFSVIYKKKKKKNLFLFINTFCLLLSFFPTSTSRFVAAAIYLGLLITISNKIKTNRLFPLLLIFALIIIWPFLNSFRNTSFDNVNIFSSLLEAMKRIGVFWLDGDFDAYSMIMSTIKYVDINGSTFGRQLFGSVFFWIPRTFWANKPIGSGGFISGELNFSFFNVSCPLQAECYVNFGILGIVIGSILSGFITRKIDDAYWNTKCVDHTRLFDTLYPILCILFFFMSRGDLMTSGSYMFCAFIIWFLSCCITQKRSSHFVCSKSLDNKFIAIN